MVQDRQRKHLWWDACGVKVAAIALLVVSGVVYLLS